MFDAYTIGEYVLLAFALVGFVGVALALIWYGVPFVVGLAFVAMHAVRYPGGIDAAATMLRVERELHNDARIARVIGSDPDEVAAAAFAARSRVARIGRD